MVLIHRYTGMPYDDHTHPMYYFSPVLPVNVLLNGRDRSLTPFAYLAATDIHASGQFPPL
jgi:hypothetical protein